MKIYVFVAEDGETAQNLLLDAERRGLVLSMFIGDDAEGVRLMQMYDITTRPAVLVTMDDGSYVHAWQTRMPSLADISHIAEGRA